MEVVVRVASVHEAWHGVTSFAGRRSGRYSLQVGPIVLSGGAVPGDAGARDLMAQLEVLVGSVTGSSSLAV